MSKIQLIAVTGYTADNKVVSEQFLCGPGEFDAQVDAWASANNIIEWTRDSWTIREF